MQAALDSRPEDEDESEELLSSDDFDDCPRARFDGVEAREITELSESLKARSSLWKEWTICTVKKKWADLNQNGPFKQ